MRKTELLRVQKQDINFFKRTIIVQSAKNHKLRVVHIDLKLAIKLFFYCRKLDDTELLFKLDCSYVSATFCNIMRNSKLQRISFHDLRHIYASYLLSKSKNKANVILSVSRQLGHSNAVETLRTYSHVLDIDINYAVQAFNFI